MIHNFSILMFEPNKKRNIEDVEKLIDFNKLNIDAESLFLNFHEFNKLFIDSVTSKLVAWQYVGDEKITMSSDFIEFLELSETISPDLSLENILLKIKETGIKSLNEVEVKFLESGSYNENNTFEYNVAMIDTNMSPEEFGRTIHDNEINNLDGDRVFDVMFNKKAEKIFIDRTTNNIIAYSVKLGDFYELKFLDMFMENLKWMPEMSSEPITLTPLTIDSVLEKISKVGYNKISKREKDFLESASKNM